MASRSVRFIVGVILFFVSLAWFAYALDVASRESSFINAVGWAIPFVFLEISIYLLFSAGIEGRTGVVVALAVCGFVVVIGGVSGYLITAPWPVQSLAPIWTAIIGIGVLLMVPLAVYLGRRAKIR